MTGGRFALVDPPDLDGEHLVVVQSEAGNASFDITVQITGPSQSGEQEGAAEASPRPVGYEEFDGNHLLRTCDIDG